MFRTNHAFSGFSVDDIAAAKAFYGDTLGLEVAERSGMLQITIGNGSQVLIYPKGEAHAPATYTCLNFRSTTSRRQSTNYAKGVRFEIYDTEYLKTDAKGIARGDGPAIAWFTDPAGNILSVLEAEV